MKTKRYFLLITFCCYITNAFTQLDRHTWYFGGYQNGVQAGISFDFVTNEPSPVTNRFPLQMQENSVIVSDPATGDVAFYSDGQTVVDGNHQVMPAGNNLFGHESAQYGTTVVQDPAACTGRYYLFYVQAEELAAPHNIYYSVVDNSLPGNGTITDPRGDVDASLKNIQVNPPGLDCGEGIFSIPKAPPSKDSWLVFLGISTRSIYVYEVGASGVTEAHVYPLAAMFPQFPASRLQGCHVSFRPESPDRGRIILSAHVGSDFPLGHFDFNMVTGEIDLNSYEEIDPSTSWVYGMTLSPDKTKFYYSDYIEKSLKQYDFTSQTVTTIGVSPHNGRTGGVELGPDGKLYWANVYFISNSAPIRYLSVVQQPNELGSACDLVWDGWEINGNPDPGKLGAFPTFGSFPQPPTATLLTAAGCGTPGSAQLNPTNIAPPYTIEWDNGETTLTASQLSGGWHFVTITEAAGCAQTASVFVPDSGAAGTDDFVVTTANPPTCDVGDLGELFVFSAGALIPDTDYLISYLMDGVWVGPLTERTDPNGDLQLGVPVGVYDSLTIFDAVSGCEYVLTGPWQLTAPNAPIPTIAVAPFCPGDTLRLLTTDILPGAQVSWTGPNGFSSAENNPVVTDSVTAIHEGEYSVFVVQNSCRSVLLNVVIEQVDARIDLGPDIDTCATAITVFADFAFSNIQWSNGAGGYSVELTESTELSVLAENVNGCVVHDTLQVSLFPSLNFDLGPDLSFCTDDTLRETLTGPAGMATYDWSTGDDTETIAITMAGTYTLRVSLGNCEATDSITIGYWPEPELDIGPDTSLCLGASLWLTPDQPFQEYLWSTGSTGEQLRIDFAGTFWLDVIDENGCPASDTIKLWTIFPPEVSIDADSLIPLGGQTILHANADGGTGQLTYQWVPDTWLDCNDCRFPVAMPLESIEYLLIVTDEQGCADSTRFFVQVDEMRRVYIPNVFSPNTDGHNDFFRLYADEGVAGINRIQIFNRWGAVIFEGGPADLDSPAVWWDGRFKNEKLDPGVFVYQFEVLFIDGQTKVYSGSITLVR